MSISNVIITRGLPLSLLVNLNDKNNLVNLNDGNWEFEIELKEKTEFGKATFPINFTSADEGVLIELTSEQTLELNSNVGQYVFILRVSKSDQTVNLRNIVRAVVINDI